MSFYKGSKNISGLVKPTDLEDILVDDTTVSNLTAWSKTEFDRRRLSIINDTTTSTSTTWSSDYFIGKLRGWETITWSDVFALSSSFTLSSYVTVMRNSFLRMIAIGVQGTQTTAVNANTYFEPITIKTGYRPIVAAPIVGIWGGKAYDGFLSTGGNFWISSQSATAANSSISFGCTWNY